MTLAPGREPRIASFARLERGGELPSDLADYTRRLTWLWTGVVLRVRSGRTAACRVRSASRLVGVRERRELRRGGGVVRRRVPVSQDSLPALPACAARDAGPHRRAGSPLARRGEDAADEPSAAARRLRARRDDRQCTTGACSPRGEFIAAAHALAASPPRGRMRLAAVRRSARVRARVRRDAVAPVDRAAAAESRGACDRSHRAGARAGVRARRSRRRRIRRAGDRRRSLGARSRRPDDVPSIADDHVAAIVYTSGTTGDPQPHAKTWSSLVRGAAGLRERIGFRPGDAIVGAVPAAAHVGTRSDGHACRCKAAASFTPASRCFRTTSPRRSRSFQSGRRWLVLTPLHIRSCVQSNVQLPPLAGVLTATSALERDVAERFERATGAPTIEIYGSTETGVIGTRRPALESAFTPLRGLSVEAHADGLLLRGAQLDGDVRLRDRAVVAPDGRFTLAGRDADLVKVGGKRASLAMLNQALLAIDGVVDGAFVVLETPRVDAAARGARRRAGARRAAHRGRVARACRPRVPAAAAASGRRACLVTRLARCRWKRCAGASWNCPLRRAPAPANACVREFVVPATHPALPGHFPGRPIVPAAWLLTLVDDGVSRGVGQHAGVDPPRPRALSCTARAGRSARSLDRRATAIALRARVQPAWRTVDHVRVATRQVQTPGRRRRDHAASPSRDDDRSEPGLACAARARHAAAHCA